MIFMRIRIIYLVAMSALLVGSITTVSGCASFEKCEGTYCQVDKQITTDMNEQIRLHREFGPPADFHVQTLNGVLYINGQVDTDLVSRDMEAVARQINNVRDVVNNIVVRGNSR
jgi:osmotically-inducible protein OsmY